MPAVRILGLPRDLSRKFTRACEITGSRRANWLAAQVRKFVLETEARYGDLFEAFSAEEDLVLRAVASGAAEKEQVAEETHMKLARVVDVLDRLVERRAVYALPKGGKTDRARGARITLYFVVEGVLRE